MHEAEHKRMFPVIVTWFFSLPLNNREITVIFFPAAACLSCCFSNGKHACMACSESRYSRDAAKI